MAQSILSNTAVAAVGRLVNSLFGVAITALVTRLLGPAAFGEYTLLFSYGALILLVADFGLYLTLTREIAQHPEREYAVISSVLSLRLFLLGVSLVAGTGFAYLLPSLRPLLLPFVIMALGFGFQSLSQLMMGVFQKYSVVWRATVGDLAGRFAQIASIVAVGVVTKTVTTMAGAFTIGALVTFVVHRKLLPLTGRFRPRYHLQEWVRLLRISWPLGAMLVLNAIYFRIDTLLLSLFRSAAEVGYYGLAYRLVESGLFFPAMFGGLLLPRFSEAWKKGKVAWCRRLLGESLHLTIVVTALLVVVAWLWSPDIIMLVAGKAFSPAAPLFRLLSIALVIMFFGNIFGFVLVALERQKVLLWLYAALALLNTTLNLIFIPGQGAVAAAIITILTEGVACSVAGVVVWRMTHFTFPVYRLVTVLLAAATTIVVATVLPERLPVLVEMMGVVGVYVVLNILLGTVARGHFKLLLRAPVPT